MSKMSRVKGAVFERALAGYLRPTLPRIDRAVRTGYRTADRTAADPGDLTGTDYIVWSAKDVVMPHGKSEPQPLVLASWMDDLAKMVAGSSVTPSPVGLLIHKRHGIADVGLSWCWLRVDDLGRLLGSPVSSERTAIEHDALVRLRLVDLLPALATWEQRWSRYDTTSPDTPEKG